MKSKKKRNFIAVRNIEVANIHFSDIKDKLLNKYKNELQSYLKITEHIHKIIDKELALLKTLKHNPPSKQLNFIKSHILIDRSALIESVCILDLFINSVLHDCQLYKLNIKQENIIDYHTAEDGLNECLKNISFSKKFEQKRTIIKHFRALRNQFAHNPQGAFSLSSKQESFETFLNNLDGIDINDSWWCSKNEKAWVFIPYKITSNKFLEIFFEESLLFASISW